MNSIHTHAPPPKKNRFPNSLSLALKKIKIKMKCLCTFKLTGFPGKVPSVCGTHEQCPPLTFMERGGVQHGCWLIAAQRRRKTGEERQRHREEGSPPPRARPGAPQLPLCSAPPFFFSHSCPKTGSQAVLGKPGRQKPPLHPPPPSPPFESSERSSPSSHLFFKTFSSSSSLSYLLFVSLLLLTLVKIYLGPHRGFRQIAFKERRFGAGRSLYNFAQPLDRGAAASPRAPES